MTAKNQNFEIHAGDKQTVRLELKDSENVAINLTGSTLVWRARGNVRRADLLEKTSGAGITVSAPLTGVVSILLLSADTSARRGLYFHELDVTDAAGTPSTVATGLMNVLPGI